MSDGYDVEVAEEEMRGLIAEVLQRLAADPAAAHLFQWRARPGCADEPYGKSRRTHLGALVGLLGATSLPTLLAACDCCGDDPCACADDPCACADDPCASDGGTRRDARVLPCGDDPCAVLLDASLEDAGRRDGGPMNCADDPCAG